MLEPLVLERPTSTTRELAGQLNVANTTGVHLLKYIEKILVAGKWVPYQLSSENRQQRIACSQSFCRALSGIILSRIVTGDEKLIL